MSIRDNDNFKKWFGDYDDPDAYTSKYKGDNLPSMATKDGKPITMYHATTKNFKAFEIGRETYNNYGFFGNVGTKRHAIFVTPDIEFAHHYITNHDDNSYASGANIMPLYVSAKRPLDLRRFDIVYDEDFEQELRDNGINPRWVRSISKVWELFDDEDGETFVTALQNMGYDSVIFYEADEWTGGKDAVVYALFSPNQLKSAIGNKGTYSSESDNITENKAMKNLLKL